MINRKRATEHWPRALILLHWTTGLLALAVASLGVFLLSPPEWTQLYVDRYMVWIGWHRLGGLAVFIMASVWIALRVAMPRPARPGGRVLQSASRFAHAVLFALLIALPVVGYVMDSLINVRLVLPAGLSLPSPLPRHEALSIAMSYAHKWGGYALLGLAAMHVIAAVAHASRPGDRTLSSMLPGFSRKPPIS